MRRGPCQPCRFLTRAARFGAATVRERLLRAAPVLLLAALAAPPAYAQFELYVVDGNVEHPVSAVYNFGSIYTGESASGHFRLRNTSNAPATMTVLQVAGAGFTLTGPALPLGLASQAAADFTVTFSGQDTGAYSAALRSDGISVLLTIAVQPRLTYLVQSGGSLLPLGSGGVDFGTALRNATVLRHLVIQNQTSVLLTVPAISIPAGDFSLAGVPPSGTALQPGQTSAFDLQFTPSTVGARTGTLVIGDRSYPLTGIGQDLPLPKPSLAIDLKQAASLQQGVVTVRFDAPAQAAGTGTVTLAFQASNQIANQGASDPAIVFASGGNTASFAVSTGDTQATVQFQTGTTAGTLTFTVQLGAATDSQSVTIAPAAAGITAVQGIRSSGSIEVRVTGFDNTRSLGQLAFTFYDPSGAAIAPGAIRTDSTKDFGAFFQTSGAGGVFLLRAVFPVTGNASGIASFDVALTNSAGTSKTSLTLF
jgi:hypothetical protein